MVIAEGQGHFVGVNPSGEKKTSGLIFLSNLGSCISNQIYHNIGCRVLGINM